MARKVSYLSYNMTTADANNPDGLVPFGRQFDFIGDVETEEMILVDGDESLCLGYTGVVCHQDVYVGDMIDYKANLTHIGNTSRKMKFEARKVAVPRPDISDSAADFLAEPIVVAVAEGTCVTPKKCQRIPH